MKYKKRELIVDAIMYAGNNDEEIAKFLNTSYSSVKENLHIGEYVCIYGDGGGAIRFKSSKESFESEYSVLDDQPKKSHPSNLTEIHSKFIQLRDKLNNIEDKALLTESMDELFGLISHQDNLIDNLSKDILKLEADRIGFANWLIWRTPSQRTMEELIKEYNNQNK